MCDSVRIDEVTSELDEHQADRGFSGGDTAGETNPQHQMERRKRAAFSVFFMRTAIVIGPTPPGTGVSMEATSLTLRSSTSPAQMYPRFSKSFHRAGSSPNSRWTCDRSATLLVPTSMTTAPGLTQSRVTMAVLPIAATTMSAWRTTSERLRVFE